MTIGFTYAHSLQKPAEVKSWDFTVVLGDWKIFELYQLLLVYCMFDFIFTIYTDLADLLVIYWHS